jgi:hypothetical protein
MLAGDCLLRQDSGIFLYRHAAAIVDPRAHLLPWPRIAALRKACEADGLLRVADIALLGTLTAEQCAGLAEEFPAAEPTRLGHWGGVLAFYRALEPAARARLGAGLPFREAGLFARQGLLRTPDRQNVSAAALLDRHGARAVVSLVEETAGEARRIAWEVRVPGEPPHRRTFAVARRRPFDDD